MDMISIFSPFPTPFDARSLMLSHYIRSHPRRRPRWWHEIKLLDDNRSIIKECLSLSLTITSNLVV
jgi:hypothetical protein